MRPGLPLAHGAASGWSGAWAWLREAQGEYRRVAWPTRSAVLNNSVVVAVTAGVLVGAIAMLDIGLSRIVTALF